MKGQASTKFLAKYLDMNMVDKLDPIKILLISLDFDYSNNQAKYKMLIIGLENI